jgi:hypothetical protein
MRHSMHTAPSNAASQTPRADEAMAMSALQTTREAIARWSGKEVPAALVRDVARVSPQARWLAETQRGLTAFFSNGGFAQFDTPGTPLPALVTPTMYSFQPCVKACMD